MSDSDKVRITGSSKLTHVQSKQAGTANRGPEEGSQAFIQRQHANFNPSTLLLGQGQVCPPRKQTESASDKHDVRSSHQQSFRSGGNEISSSQDPQNPKAMSNFKQPSSSLSKLLFPMPADNQNTNAAVSQSAEPCTEGEAACDTKHCPDLNPTQRPESQLLKATLKLTAPSDKAGSAAEALIKCLSSEEAHTGSKGGVATLIFGKQFAATPPEASNSESPAIGFQLGKMSNDSSSASRAMTNVSSADGNKPSPADRTQQDIAFPIQASFYDQRSSRVTNLSQTCKPPPGRTNESPEVNLLRILLLMIRCKTHDIRSLHCVQSEIVMKLSWKLLGSDESCHSFSNQLGNAGDG